MHIIYRTSEVGHPKVKPPYITSANCFLNARKMFPNSAWSVIADNITDETKKFLEEQGVTVTMVSIGNGAGTFNLALDMALKLPDREVVYFLENDYLHLDNAERVLECAFQLPIHYATLYDHPDKYRDPVEGGNPLCIGGSEETRVMLGEFCHWKITNSTTMTFAAKVGTLREDEKILRKHTVGTHPKDFVMFQDLKKKKRILASPIPSYSTHGEVKWLAPFVNWERLARP